MPHPSPVFRIRNIPHRADPRSLSQSLARELPSVASADHVDVLSLAYTWSFSRSSSTKVATVSFSHLPSILNDGAAEWTLRAIFDDTPCTLTLDTHFQDFTVFNDPDWDGRDDDFADLIAIPGLTGHPYTSWVHPEQPEHHWLRDQLPLSFPRLRCSLYGYDARLSDTVAFNSIDDIAATLKEQLRSSHHPSGARPICFIAHSIGGVILKKTLLLLSAGDHVDRSLLRSVRCCLLFGVPNRGLPDNHLESMVSSDLNVSIIQELSHRSPQLRHLDDAFSSNPDLAHIRTVSFFETKASDLSRRPSEVSDSSDTSDGIVVDMQSALQACSRTSSVDQQALDKQHAFLVSFTDRDFAYNSVHTCLRDFCSDAGINAPTSSQASLKPSRSHQSSFASPSAKTSPEPVAADWSTISSRHSVDDTVPRWSRQSFYGIENWEGATLNNSVAEEQKRFAKIRNPLGSSCIWAYKYEELEFRRWLDQGTGIYHITGEIGTGKSVLMKHLVMSAHSLVQPDEAVLDTIITSYFFDRMGDAEHRELDAFRQSTLCQLLMVEPKLRPLMESIIPAEYTYQKNWNSLRLSQGMARLVTQKTLPIRIIIFIDALEQCQAGAEEACRMIQDLVEASSRSATRLSVCISSRPTPLITSCLKGCPGFRMEHQTKLFLRIYVKERLKNLRPDYKPPKNELEFLGGRGVVSSGYKKTGDYYELVERVLEKARGSYEWTRHALTVMNREALDKDDAKELIDIVRDLPDKPGELARLRVSYR